MLRLIAQTYMTQQHAVPRRGAIGTAHADFAPQTIFAPVGTITYDPAKKQQTIILIYLLLVQQALKIVIKQ